MHNFDMNQVIEYIKSSSEQSKIYIGADSECYKKHGKWFVDYTVAIVIHKDGNKGCKVFGKTDSEQEFDKKKNKPALRLMNEVYRATQMYLDLADYIGDRHCEVHLDISPEATNGSSCVIQQATGYVRGMCGFTPKVKPDAFSASYAADRFKEIAA
jgi:predicted RNase H-related nuclease YkuK (DUF458 family)